MRYNKQKNEKPIEVKCALKYQNIETVSEQEKSITEENGNFMSEKEIRETLKTLSDNNYVKSQARKTKYEEKPM